MRHTFAVDVLACPRCGGRMRVVATIDDPVVVRKILTHLGLATDVPASRPPPSDLFGWTWGRLARGVFPPLTLGSASARACLATGQHPAGPRITRLSAGTVSRLG